MKMTEAGITNLLDGRLLDPEDEKTLAAELKIYQAIQSRTLADQGAWAAEQVCERLGLEAMFSCFGEWNTASVAPYHNNHHTMRMILDCYEAAVVEKLSIEDTQVLVLAAMFHDFNHTAGAEDDAVNIEKAIRGMNQLAALAYCPKSMCDKAASVIQITKYPHERAPSTQLERIIRDADYMSLYEANEATLLIQFVGLKSEVERGQKRSFDAHEYAQGINDFFKNTVWHSYWGAEKSTLRDFTQHLNRLVGLLHRVKI